jgi:hypothetical protein
MPRTQRPRSWTSCQCVVLIDNGHGMSGNQLFRLMNHFGFSTKATSKVAVGGFGQGFKKAAVQLARYSLVLSRAEPNGALACGLFAFPADRERSDQPIANRTFPLEAVAEELRKEGCPDVNLKGAVEALELVKARLAAGRRGTAIVLVELLPGLELSADGTDIVLTSVLDPSQFTSLRQFCTWLYLRPALTVTIGDEPVGTILCTSRLVAPLAFSERSVRMLDGAKRCARRRCGVGVARQAVDGVACRFRCTVGQLPDLADSKDQQQRKYGPLLYYRSRLVESFRTVELERWLAVDVTAPLRERSVVLIAELSEVCGAEVTSSKDSFDETEAFMALFKFFACALSQYAQRPSMGDKGRPIDWIRCDKCHKWRTTTAAIVTAFRRKRFVCDQNDSQFITSCAGGQEEFNEEAEVWQPRCVHKAVQFGDARACGCPACAGDRCHRR